MPKSMQPRSSNTSATCHQNASRATGNGERHGGILPARRHASHLRRAAHDRHVSHALLRSVVAVPHRRRTIPLSGVTSTDASRQCQPAELAATVLTACEASGSAKRTRGDGQNCVRSVRFLVSCHGRCFASLSYLTLYKVDSAAIRSVYGLQRRSALIAADPEAQAQVHPCAGSSTRVIDGRSVYPRFRSTPSRAGRPGLAR